MSIDLTRAAGWAQEHATTVSLSSPWHGPRHWRDVARIAKILYMADGDASGPMDVDLEVMFLFAAFHDTQRNNEYSDPEHGERAFDSLVEASEAKIAGLNTLTQWQSEMLIKAIAGHDQGGCTHVATIGYCWDADRLTLSRVGHTPNVRFMSSNYARRHFEKALNYAEIIMQDMDMSWAEVAQLYKDHGRGRHYERTRSLPA